MLFVQSFVEIASILSIVILYGTITVAAFEFQICRIQKNVLTNKSGDYDQKRKECKFSSFYQIFREIYISNILFHCICLTICSKPLGSRTLLENSMGSAEPMKPMLTLPLYKVLIGPVQTC